MVSGFRTLCVVSSRANVVGVSPWSPCLRNTDAVWLCQREEGRRYSPSYGSPICAMAGSTVLTTASSVRSSVMLGPLLSPDDKLASHGSSGIMLYAVNADGSQTDGTRDSLSTAPSPLAHLEGRNMAGAVPAQSFAGPLSVSQDGRRPGEASFSLGRAIAPLSSDVSYGSFTAPLQSSRT